MLLAAAVWCLGRAASRRWAQRRFPDIRYWGEPASAGHFAAFAQPDLFVNEISSFFRLIR
jgi:epoxide hydrolase